MIRLIITCLILGMPSVLDAGTIVITSLPDESRPFLPLTSVEGTELNIGSEIRVGAFPGMTDDEILDVAKAGGLTVVTNSFVGFGEVQSIGQGADDAPGMFEISVRQQVVTGSPLLGEEISLLIRKRTGDEFLIVRFKDRRFEEDSPTGLESVLPLHLAESKVVAGNGYGATRFSTSPATDRGSFGEWMKTFADLEEDERLPDVDPDGDGRSNFIEYVTGGNPSSAAEEAPLEIARNGGGTALIRFSSSAGIGVQPVVEWSPDLMVPWTALDEEPAPGPVIGGSHWFTIPVPEPSADRGFFRLRIGPG